MAAGDGGVRARGKRLDRSVIDQGDRARTRRRDAHADPGAPADQLDERRRLGAFGASQEGENREGDNRSEGAEQRRDDEAGRYELSTPFIYVEARAEQQLLLGGVYRHTLQQVEGALRILLKRVDLLNAEAAFPAIQLFP